jgi:pentatricopeptide repeat protein
MSVRIGGPSGAVTWGLDEGLCVLQSMSQDGLEADVVTYTALLDTCIASLRGAGTTATVEHCSMILSMMRNAGVQPNAVSYTSLITAAKVDGDPKSVALAEELFYELEPAQRNGRMYTALIGALARVGRVQDALKVFKDATLVVEPDAIMFSAAMGAVANDARKVLKLHDDMRARGIPDDDVTRWQVKKAQGKPRPRAHGAHGPRHTQVRNMPASTFVPSWRTTRSSDPLRDSPLGTSRTPPPSSSPSPGPGHTSRRPGEEEEEDLFGQ